MDDDRNRKLSSNEFRKGVDEYGLNFSKSEIEELFRLFDIDHSGTIDYEEFLRKLRVKDFFFLVKASVYIWIHSILFKPPMNCFRLDLVARAFAKLDR